MRIRFIEHNLAPGEKLLYRVQPHWIVLGYPILFTIAIIFFAHLFPLAETLIYFAIPVLVVAWIAKLIEFTCSEFGVTNKRILVKIGLIRIDIVDTPLQRIESVQVSQTLLGRILGYGTVMICGTGGDRYPFSYIKHPLLFRSHAQEQISLLGTA